MDAVLEFVIELLLEIVVEGGEAVITSKKTSKWLRYLVIFILFLLTFAALGFFGILGISIMKETVFGGVIILGFILFFTVLIITKARKMYKELKMQKENLLDEYKEQNGISPELK